MLIWSDALKMHYKCYPIPHHLFHQADTLSQASFSGNLAQTQVAHQEQCLLIYFNAAIKEKLVNIPPFNLCRRKNYQTKKEQLKEPSIEATAIIKTDWQ